MKEITRDVVLDLLPLYQANELSPDSRALVKKYLETDPELAERAKGSVATEFLDDIPIPFTQEDKVKAYLEAKRLMFWRTVIVTIAVTFVVLSVLGMAMLVAFRTF